MRNRRLLRPQEKRAKVCPVLWVHYTPPLFFGLEVENRLSLPALEKLHQNRYKRVSAQTEALAARTIFFHVGVASPFTKPVTLSQTIRSVSQYAN